MEASFIILVVRISPHLILASFVFCPRILASWSKGFLDTREIRTREEGEVINPEKEIDPPEEEAAVETTADLPLLLALAYSARGASRAHREGGVSARVVRLRETK